MKVTVDGKEYLVYFRYDGRQTIAHVEDTDKRPLSVGVADCSIFDNFSRITGRKIALARALGRLFDGWQGKAARRQVWEQLKEKGMKVVCR